VCPGLLALVDDLFSVFIALYITQSSVNNLAMEWRLSAMSLMNTRNKVGSSTVPWGTPDVA
jgi:hypothetical protein